MNEQDVGLLDVTVQHARHRQDLFPTLTGDPLRFAARVSVHQDSHMTLSRSEGSVPGAWRSMATGAGACQEGGALDR